MTGLLISWLCKDDMQEFATRLRQARTTRKMTQTRLAELLKVDRRVYNRWERGGALPLLDTVVRIAQVLQISLDELVGLEPMSELPMIHNPKLHALLQKLDSLSDEDQQTLFVLMDSLMKRSEMAKLLAN